MPSITAGPSVLVSPNSSITFSWTVDATWNARVDFYAKKDDALPFFTQWLKDANDAKLASMTPSIKVLVAGSIAADTTYYFQVTSEDPNSSGNDAPSPRYSLFTGAQALTSPTALSISDTGAIISWDGNVVGYGRVVAGTATGDDIAFKTLNTLHTVPLSGLTPSTTYQYTATTIDAVDKTTVLASTTGQFTTAASTSFVFNQPHAEPRTITSGAASTVSVRAWNGTTGTPVAGMLVGFSIASGSGTLSTNQGTTDSNGIANVVVTGGSSHGLVDVQCSSPSATNGPFKIPVIIK